MVIVPLRPIVNVLTATVYATVPVPTPDDVVAIHDALLIAVQPHPVVAVAVNDPLRPPDGAITDGLEREIEQAIYVYPVESLPDCASRFMTATSTGPAACAELVAVATFEVSIETPVAEVPPRVTDIPLAKFVPYSVTGEPPVAGPAIEAMRVTVGAVEADTFA